MAASPTAASSSEDFLPVRRKRSFTFLPPTMSELRVVLLGSNWSERRDVGNVILEDTKFNTVNKTDCERVRARLRDKEIVLINTPDLLLPNISDDNLKEHVETCVRLSAPGPHVFLLVLQSKDFTEDHKQRLCKILQLFSDRSFDHSLILISPRDKSSFETDMNHSSLKDMIRMCSYRYLWQKDLEHSELLTRLGQTAKENNEEYLGQRPKSVLNLVLCGRRGAGKTSAAKAVLGQTELHSVSNSSECVKNQGEVCGRWLSLVELPALYGKPQEEVMEELLRCISLCDPEGVHAFILVLPVDSLTDEDKGELETIQNTFGSRVNDFTMILFTVESDPTDPAVLKENGDIQQLCESCGGRSTVLNIKEKQQIPELLEIVESMRGEQTRCFTKDIFITGQMEKVSKLTAELQDVTQRAEVGGDDDSQSRVRKNYSSCYPAKVSDATKEVSQIQVEKLLKEQEEETRRKEKELIELQKKISEQKAQLEEEKNLRNRQLKEKDDLINRERKERERKHEEEERRRKKQEETQRQEWKRKLEDSEKRAEKKLEQSRKEMKKERDAWDKERKELWERIHQEQKQNLEEVKVRNQKLQEEYQWKRKKWICIVSLLFVLFFIILYISK